MAASRATSSSTSPIPGAEPSGRGLGVAAALGWYALVAGLLSFAGWVLDVRRLSAWGGAISIQPNAALAAAAAGAGLVLLAHGRRRSVVPFAALSSLIGLATLFEHTAGIDLGTQRRQLAQAGGGAGAGDAAVAEEQGGVVYGRRSRAVDQAPVADQRGRLGGLHGKAPCRSVRS